MNGFNGDGYYWATIKNTGCLEIIEMVFDSHFPEKPPLILRMGDELVLDITQVDILESVAPLTVD
jgi:hypothetical protein